MGVGNLGRIAGMLLAGGRAPDTPVALVRWGTTARQEVLTGDLVDIADEARRAGFASPATIVVGEVVDLRSLIAGLPADLDVTASEAADRRLGTPDSAAPALTG
jgi:siroheme synthase